MMKDGIVVEQDELEEPGSQPDLVSGLTSFLTSTLNSRALAEAEMECLHEFHHPLNTRERCWSIDIGDVLSRRGPDQPVRQARA